jgi:hypothetical protein
MIRRAGWFALAALTVPLLTAADMTTLKIEVKNGADKPVDRASVVVDFLGSRQIMKLGRKTRTHWELRTNQEGVAKIPPIPQGRIRVQVIAKSYQTFGGVFEVEEAEKTIPVKLNAPQPQFSAHE